MPFGLVDLINFVFQNIFWFIFLGVGFFLIWNYFRIKQKKTVIVNRSNVERLNFIERMKFNPSTTFKWLYKGFTETNNPHKNYKGKVFLGKITHYTETIVPNTDNKFKISDEQFKKFKKEIKDLQDLVKDQYSKIMKKEYKDFEIAKTEYHKTRQLLIDKVAYIKKTRLKIASIVLKPMVIKSLNIANPFKKVQILQFEIDSNIAFKNKDSIFINETVALTNYLGIYHQIGESQKMIIDNIRDNDIILTDLNNLGSIYFSKSQEQSTFDPVYAHSLALAEKNLQIEMARKKGKVDTI